MHLNEMLRVIKYLTVSLWSNRSFEKPARLDYQGASGNGFFSSPVGSKFPNFGRLNRLLIGRGFKTRDAKMAMLTLQGFYKLPSPRKARRRSTYSKT